MSRETPTPRAPGTPAPSAEKKALLDAFITVLKRQAEDRDTGTKKRQHLLRRPLFAGSTVILLAVGGYLAIMRPTWVFGPSIAPETVALKEASLRIGMASAAQHVERFRRKQGRLPESLTEAGAPGSGLRYEPLGSTGYRLHGENGPAKAVWTSGEPLSDFLGQSYEIIARRPR
jgi:hypothetical protein